MGKDRGASSGAVTQDSLQQWEKRACGPTRPSRGPGRCLLLPPSGHVTAAGKRGLHGDPRVRSPGWVHVEALKPQMPPLATPLAPRPAPAMPRRF